VIEIKIKSLGYRLFISIAGWILFAANGLAQTDALEQKSVAPKLDEYMNAMTNSGLFMGAVLVAQDGKVLLSKGYGMANLEYDIPNSSHTKFDIASVSKTFTATLILMLQERGRLSVQDSICKYLNECPDAWRGITIHHLLTHTSGITNYTDLPDQFEMRALESFIPDAIKRIKHLPLQFQPGEKFNYSNTGYKLLHEIIEKTSGKSFEAFLQESILDPLKMKDTGVFEKPGIRHLIVKARAEGYTDGTGPLEIAPWVYPNYGGGIYSTVEDMYLWGQSFFSEKLLSKQTLDATFTPFKGNYAYGWFIFNKPKHRFVMHGGNIPGYGLTFALYPDDRLIIVVASNLDTAPTSRIHDDLAAIVFLEKYQLPPKWNAVKVDPKIYDRYVGRYQKTDDPKFIITITKENDQLWNRLGDDPGAATMVLRPLSETKFFNKMFVLYEATFVVDERGLATGLIAEGPWGRNEFKRIE
jgi:CubicO group peptidase (beta-lactamase class C family)